MAYLMDADKRTSARKRVKSFPHLRENLAHTEGQDARGGVNLITQAQKKESFPPNSHDDSESDETREETSSTVRRNAGGTPKDGGEPQNIRNEDRATVRSVVRPGESLLRSLSPHPPSFGGGKIFEASNSIPGLPSIGEGELDDPTNDVSSPRSIAGGTLHEPIISAVPSMSEAEAHAGSISDASIERRRESDASAKSAEEDGSVTPGRRAPYHPGNEVAGPGRGYIPPRPRVSSCKRNRSPLSEP